MNYLISISILLFMITGCDPVHRLTMENGTQAENIEVLYASEHYIGKVNSDTVVLNGKILQRIILHPGEEITIGTVPNKYLPEAQDISMEYLELRFKDDTIVFNGKKAIFSCFQKEGNLSRKYMVRLNQ